MTATSAKPDAEPVFENQFYHLVINHDCRYVRNLNYVPIKATVATMFKNPESSLGFSLKDTQVELEPGEVRYFDDDILGVFEPGADVLAILDKLVTPGRKDLPPAMGRSPWKTLAGPTCLMVSCEWLYNPGQRHVTATVAVALGSRLAWVKPTLAPGEVKRIPVWKLVVPENEAREEKGLPPLCMVPEMVAAYEGDQPTPRMLNLLKRLGLRGQMTSNARVTEQRRKENAQREQAHRDHIRRKNEERKYAEKHAERKRMSGPVTVAPPPGE